MIYRLVINLSQATVLITDLNKPECGMLYCVARLMLMQRQNNSDENNYNVSVGGGQLYTMFMQSILFSQLFLRCLKL